METKLNNETRHAADVMLALQRYAFDRITNRQGFEWRLCISLWTVAAILLGFLLKGDIALTATTEKVGLTMLAALMPLLHFLWIRGAGRRSRLDMLMSIFWDKQLLRLMNVDYDSDITDELGRLKTTTGQVRTYSFLFQVSTTILLAIGIACAAWK